MKHIALVNIDCHLPQGTPITQIAKATLQNISRANTVNQRIYSLMSSAYNFTVKSGPRTSTISLINSKNINGPNALPCGTPLRTLVKEDLLVPILTAWVRSDRKSCNHNSNLPVIPFWILSGRTECRPDDSHCCL